MATNNKNSESQNPIFKTPPAPETQPPTKPTNAPTLQNNPPPIEGGIQKFSATPVEQNDPNLPRLKSQSPPETQPQAPPAPPPQPKLKILGLFFNKITLFLAIVILLFISSAGLILAYTNYIVFAPPKNIQNLIDRIIINSPLPKDSRLQKLKER